MGREVRRKDHERSLAAIAIPALVYNRAVDAAGTKVVQNESIDSDLNCIKCAYNLRGLRPCGRCPECGTCIKETIVARSLVRSKPPAVACFLVSSIGPLMPIGLYGYGNIVIPFWAMQHIAAIWLFCVCVARMETARWWEKLLSVLGLILLIASVIWDFAFFAMLPRC